MAMASLRNLPSTCAKVHLGCSRNGLFKVKIPFSARRKISFFHEEGKEWVKGKEVRIKIIPLLPLVKPFLCSPPPGKIKKTLGGQGGLK
jgi:hypothetical protein